MSRILSLSAALCLAASSTAMAEVKTAEPGGFKLVGSTTVAASPQQLWSVLVHPDDWWSRSHRWFEGSRLTLDASPAGCWCETHADGRGARHMTTAMADPSKRLLLHGGLGPLSSLGVAGALDFTLTPQEDGTRLDWTYTVGGYAEGGLQAWAGPVDGVLKAQIARLKTEAEAR